MRFIDLLEAQQLMWERFLAAHWEELAAARAMEGEGSADKEVRRPGTQLELPTGLRRPLVQRDQFDSDPRQLRENLRKLEVLLEDCEVAVRRRIRLAFGDLVASWQSRFAGEAISVVIEVLADSVRVSVCNPNRRITPGEWKDVMSAPVAGLVDAWGIDRRLVGRAWFEFQRDPSEVARTERASPAHTR